MKNMKQASSLFKQKIALRSIIILFYLTIIVFFLFFSRIQEFFLQDKTLNIYAFAEYISFESIKEFEQKYGVKVSIKNFESNEELLTKFKITGGQGYDLVTPSDYMIELLRKEDLLHKLDHSKLPIFKEIDEHLLNKTYDPGNHYSIPCGWNIYGIVFKKDLFQIIPDSLSLDIMFKNEASLPYHFAKPYKVCMVDDSIESCFFSSLYLFGDVKHFDTYRLNKIKTLLINQRKKLAMYSSQDIRFYLFSDIFSVALTTSMNMKRILKERDDFDFKIPQEGSIMSIEGLVIPAQCKKLDLVYKFINFILSKEMMHLNSSLFGYNPSNKHVYLLIDDRFTKNLNFFPDEKTFSRLHLLHNNVSLNELEEVWLTVKSKS